MGPGRQEAGLSRAAIKSIQRTFQDRDPSK